MGRWSRMTTNSAAASTRATHCRRYRLAAREVSAFRQVGVVPDLDVVASHVVKLLRRRSVDADRAWARWPGCWRRIPAWCWRSVSHDRRCGSRQLVPTCGVFGEPGDQRPPRRYAGPAAPTPRGISVPARCRSKHRRGDRRQLRIQLRGVKPATQDQIRVAAAMARRSGALRVPTPGRSV